MTTTLTEKTFAQLFTFAGATVGTCVNAQGWVQPSATPRFDHDPITKAAKGLLIESARTNQMGYASRLELWARNSLVSVVPDAAIAPNGRYDASKVVLDLGATSGTPFVSRAITKTGVATQYTVSAYFKAAGLVGATFMLTGASAADRVNFELNLDVKSVLTSVFGGFTGASAKIVEAGNGWIRVEGTVTSDAGTGAAVRIYPKSGSGGVIDGVSGIYVWGVQIEEGPFATSFIPSLETFTGRTSTGSYYDANGVMRTAAAGAARLSYEPSNLSLAPVLLLEGQSANLLRSTSNMHLAPWTNAGASRTPGKLAPDGTLQAVEIAGVPTGGFNHAGVAATDTTMTFSIFVKNVSRLSSINLLLRNATTSTNFAGGLVNLQLPEPTILGAGWDMRPVGNGWFRCTYTQRTGITVGNSLVCYAGFTGGGPDNGAFQVWGAQLEAGAYATSYMPSADSFSGRVSTGTYFDSTGAMKVAPGGTARMTYNPADLSIAPWLLLEEASTNLLTGSQISSGTAAGTTPPTVASATVDGEACMAATFTPANGAGYGATRALGNASAAITQGTIYTISTYVKLSRALTGNEAITLYYTGSSGMANVVINAANSSQFIDRFTRAVPAKVAPAVSGAIYPVVHTNTAVTSSLTVWICKGQVEAGSVETSYIPTTTAAATRTADTFSTVAATRAADTQTSGAHTRSADTVRIDASKGWLNAAEGTIAMEFRLPTPESASRNLLEFGGTGTGNRTGIGYQVNGSVYAYCNVNGAGVSSPTMLPAGPNAKVSLSYGTDGLRLGCNGEPLKKGAPNGVPPIPFIGLGCTATGGNHPCFHIRDVKYFPQRLTDAEVVALTA